MAQEEAPSELKLFPSHETHLNFPGGRYVPALQGSEKNESDLGYSARILLFEQQKGRSSPHTEFGVVIP